MSSLLIKRSRPLLTLCGLCNNTKYTNYARRNFAQENHFADYETNAEIISKDNLEGMLERMKTAPGIGIKLKGRQSEQAFASVLIAICTNEQG